MRIAFIVGAALGIVICDVSVSQAYSDRYSRYPWCAVQELGFGTVTRRCVFQTFEQCRPEVIAGNRGTCEPNNYYWAARYDESLKPVKRKRPAR